MTTSKPAFDEYANVYSDLVDQSVRFTRKDAEFFTRSKVDGLLSTGRRLGRPLNQLRVLDVGCGTGLADSLLMAHVASLNGVDVSAEMVATAAARNPGGRYQAYNGDRLPFSDGQFELVFAACVLHHVPPAQWDQFLAELCRVTSSPGAAVVVEHNPRNPLTRRAVRACPFDEDAVLAPAETVSRIMRQHGVDRLERRYVMFFPIDRVSARKAEKALGWLPMGAQYTVTAFR